MSSSPQQSPEEKKQTKNKLGPKIYVFQFTLYLQRNVRLGEEKNFQDVPKIFQTLPC
jgi:hypothetical protein